VAQAVIRRPPTAEVRARSQVSPCEICGGHRGTVTGFSPRTSVFPCQYHAIIFPHSSSSACCSYRQYKRAKSGKFPKSNSLSAMAERGTDKCRHSYISVSKANVAVSTVHGEM
jgi:hypothetical protein